MDPDNQRRCQATRPSSTIGRSSFQVEVTRDGKHICRHVIVGIIEVQFGVNSTPTNTAHCHHAAQDCTSLCPESNCHPRVTSHFCLHHSSQIDSFPPVEKFQFDTDMSVTIEWPNLTPRLRSGGCFEIHILHWGLCDLLLSSNQSFLLEVLHHQCVSCKEPL